MADSDQPSGQPTEVEVTAVLPLKNKWSLSKQKLQGWITTHRQLCALITVLTLSGLTILSTFALQPKTFLLSFARRANPNTLYGQIQKGPFVAGSQMIIQELDDELQPTGVSYNLTTENDFGNYALDRPLGTRYAEIIATGFYFNEVTGNLSDANLTLRSYVDLSSNNHVNVNLLTTVIQRRIAYLHGTEQLAVQAAKQQAERELLVAFNINPEIPLAAERVNIAKEGEIDAVGLAISLVLQGNSGTGNLTELTAKIGADLETDGLLTDTTNVTAESILPEFENHEGQEWWSAYHNDGAHNRGCGGYVLNLEDATKREAIVTVTYADQLAKQARYLNIDRVKENLSNRYQELGLDISPPAMEKFAHRLVPFELKGFPTDHLLEAGHRGDIRFGFNKQLDPSQVDPTIILVTTDNGMPVVGKAIIEENGFILSFEPDEALGPMTTYRYQMQGDLTSLDGETLAVSKSGLLTTGQFDIESDLIAYYPLNGDAKDASGQGRDGQITGQNTTTNRFGSESSALLLGPGNYVALPVQYNLWQNNGTLSLWFKSREVTGEARFFSPLVTYAAPGVATQATFLSVFDNSSVDTGFGFYNTPLAELYPRNYDGIVDSSSQYDLDSARSMFGNMAWHHLLVTTTPYGYTLYLDGQYVANTRSCCGSDLHHEFTLYLGSPLDNNDASTPISSSLSDVFPSNFQGSIDDVRIYSRVLEPLSIQQLYAEKN